MKLEFSDGVSVDTSGNYRIRKIKGDYFVIGHGTFSYEPDLINAARELERLMTRSVNEILKQMIANGHDDLCETCTGWTSEEISNFYINYIGEFKNA